MDLDRFVRACNRISRSLRQQKGFTLVEVLVALAIVGLALAAGTRAVGALWQDAERQERVLLGQICAANSLNQILLTGRFPDLGVREARCEQGGRTFVVATEAQTTPNPNFRRVDANVSDGDGAVVRLTTIFGNL